MSELPKGWTECNIENVGEVITGNTPPKNDLTNYGDKYPWVKPPDLGKDIPIMFTSENLSEKGGRLARLLPPGTTLVSCIGILGKIGYAGTTLATNQQINSVIFNEECVEPRFGFYYCKTLQGWLEENASSTTVAIVNKGRFMQAPFLLPPLSEQSRIVAKLEQVLARVDACRAQLEQVPAIIKRFRQSVIAAAYSGRLTEDWRTDNPYSEEYRCETPGDSPAIPDSWSWHLLSEIASLKGGVTKGRKLDPKITIQLSYLRVANVQDGYLDLREIKEIEALPIDREKYALFTGDILFTEGGDRDKLGRGTVWNGEIQDCIHQNHIFRARLTTDRILPEYITLTSKSDFSRQYFYENANQTVNLASINLRTLSALPLPIPPLAEQQEIVRRVNDLFAISDQVEVRYSQAKTHVDRLTQSILAKAFRGELVPQDPNDEPAEVLLALIQAERSKCEKKRSI